MGSEPPICLLCGRPTRLLYPSNVVDGAALLSREVACTSSDLSVHDDIFICNDCGLARSAPSIPFAEIEDLYRNVEDPEYLTSEAERRGSFRDTLEVMERYHEGAPGRLLEVGSSVGLFLEEAEKRGWRATGIEPSVWASEKARLRGLNVFSGTLDGFDAPRESFDMVVLWDVLEHLVDPLAALARVNTLLKPGGLAGMTTVNIGGLGARVFRGRWPWFMRMHLHYFTRRSLGRIAARLGFEVLQLTTYPKVLKLGYVLERARGLMGPLAAVSLWTAERLRLDRRPVTVDLGDILFLVARKKAPAGWGPEP